MELPSLVLSLSFLFFLLLIIKRRYKRNRSLNLPPGPWKLPIIGSLHHLLTATLPHHALHKLVQQHGPVMQLRLGQVDAVVVSSPEAVSEIMKSQDLNISSRPEFYSMKVLTYGCLNVSMAPYGDYWRHIRKICVLELLSAKRVRSYHSIFEEEVSKLITAIASENKPVNLSIMLPALTNNIIARCAFSTNSKQLMTAVKKMFEMISGFSIVDLFPNVKYIDVLSGMKWKVERVHRQFCEVLEYIIRDHELKRGKVGAGEVEDLVDVLLRIKDNGELDTPFTNDNIKAVILDMFAGGTETSSTLVAWTMSELIKNPHMMEKATAEVRRVLKGKTTIGESDLGELHYLKLVIKETLRLHPPGPFIVRQCIKTCQVSGYNIPIGTRVFVNLWTLGRDPRYWNDAEEFKPERFSGSSIDYKGNNFEYLPFGTGRRICPGITFASTTVELILAQLLFHFNWKLPNGMMPQELDMTESFGVATTRKIDLCLIATPYSVPVPV